MTESHACAATVPDSRPLSVVELLAAVHAKFSENFELSKEVLVEAAGPEHLARAIASATEHMSQDIGGLKHRPILISYLDEIFGDSVSAIYLASCGLHVPAKMLLRRSLELGLVVAAYWDNPSEFWQWRDHDADIRFSVLCATLSNAGYSSFLQTLPGQIEPVPEPRLEKIEKLYGELSNVVHPKPYNFSTKQSKSYKFDKDDFLATVKISTQTYTEIFEILKRRFPAIKIS